MKNNKQEQIEEMISMMAAFNIDGKPIVELDGDFVLNAAKSYGIEIKE